MRMEGHKSPGTLNTRVNVACMHVLTHIMRTSLDTYIFIQKFESHLDMDMLNVKKRSVKLRGRVTD